MRLLRTNPEFQRLMEVHNLDANELELKLESGEIKHSLMIGINTDTTMPYTPSDENYKIVTNPAETLIDGFTIY